MKKTEQSKRMKIKNGSMKNAPRIQDVIIKELLQSFLDSSSIHGIKQISIKKAHPAETIFWLLFMIMAVYGACWLSWSTWRRYQDNPTYMSLDKHFMDWETNLPAITLCPIVEYPQNHPGQLFFNTDSTKQSNISLEVPSNLLPKDYLSIVISATPKQNLTTLPSLPEKMSGSQPELIVTEMGLCYTILSAVYVYQKPRYWFTNNWTIDTKEVRMKNGPADSGIFASIEGIEGDYQAWVHSPLEIAEVSLKRWKDTKVSHLQLYFKELSIVSTSAVRDLSINQRKCRFINESNLFNSPIYTYNMCRTQCRAIFAAELCNCIPFFYRFKGKHRQCDSKGSECIYTNRENLIKMQYENGTLKKCNCLQSCDDTFYTNDEEKWDGGVFTGRMLRWGITNYPTIRIKRDVVFGWSDLLVSVGGTAGLFLGCSLLSFVEIGYFISLRFFYLIFYYVRGKYNELP